MVPSPWWDTHPIGPAFQPFDPWQHQVARTHGSTQPLPRRARASWVSRRLLAESAGRLSSSAGVSAASSVRLGPRPTISFAKHERAAPPHRLLSAGPSFLWAPGTAVRPRSLRQKAGRRGPALSPVRAPLVSSRALGSVGGGAGWGDGGRSPREGGAGNSAESTLGGASEFLSRAGGLQGARQAGKAHVPPPPFLQPCLRSSVY